MMLAVHVVWTVTGPGMKGGLRIFYKSDKSFYALNAKKKQR